MEVSLFSHVTSDSLRGTDFLGLDWIFRNISAPKGLLCFGTGCQGIPWRYLKDLWMWNFRAWFSDRLSSAGFMFRLDLGGLFKPNWFYDSANIPETNKIVLINLSLFL